MNIYLDGLVAFFSNKFIENSHLKQGEYFIDYLFIYLLLFPE